MSNPLPKTVTREQLYENVWSTPGTTLSKRYGVSDVAIWKACRQLNIPKPGLGYWAKFNAGKQPERPELPPIADGDPKSRTFFPVGWRHARDEPQKVSLPEFFTKIRPDLQGCHDLIAATLKEIRSRRYWDMSNYKWPEYFCTVVSKKAAPRALRILEALFRECERRGWKVEGQRQGQPPRIWIEREAVTLELTEKNTRNEWFPSTPAGRLVLRLDRETYYVRKLWQDGKFLRLEQQLPEILETIAVIAEEHRLRRLDREEREQAKKLEEAEKYRQRSAEQATRDEWRRRREAAAAAVAEERKRQEQLETDAIGWQRAHAIRMMCDELERRSAKDPTQYPAEATGRWLKWARATAATHDPFENGHILQGLRCGDLDETLNCQ